MRFSCTVYGRIHFRGGMAVCVWRLRGFFTGRGGGEKARTCPGPMIVPFQLDMRISSPSSRPYEHDPSPMPFSPFSSSSSRRKLRGTKTPPKEMRVRKNTLSSDNEPLAIVSQSLGFRVLKMVSDRLRCGLLYLLRPSHFDSNPGPASVSDFADKWRAPLIATAVPS